MERGKLIMTKWKNKNVEEKEYKTSFGSTDYNIPTIGYKSAFFISGLTILILIFVPMSFEIIFNGIQWPGLLVSGLLIGFVISYAQHFIQSNKGVCPSFWAVGGLFSVFAIFVLFITFYAKILI